MKFTSSVLLSLVMCVVTPTSTAVIMESPDGGPCWSSTIQIATSEVGVIFNPSLANTRRTYVMCPTTITIGVVDPSTGSPFPVGGDLLIPIINPNIEIKCEIPGTCILLGGGAQIASLGSTDLISAFVAADPNNPPLPDSYFPDSSNLIIDGMTFTGSKDILKNSGESNVQLVAHGQNMTIIRSAFKEQSTEAPPTSGIRMTRQSEIYPEGEDFFATLLVKNCTFQNSIYQDAAIQSGSNFVDSTFAGGDRFLFALTVEDVIVSNTVIEVTRNYTAASIMTLLWTIGTVKNTQIVNSTISAGPGTIVLIGSNMTFDDVTLTDNVIIKNLTECTGVALYHIKNGTNGTFFAPYDSCLELDDSEVEIAPSMAPSEVATAVPSMAPSEVATAAPSMAPSVVATAAPSVAPSVVLSDAPSLMPVEILSTSPSSSTTIETPPPPSDAPIEAPSAGPTIASSSAFSPHLCIAPVLIQLVVMLLL